ncbi:MAG: response regulator [Chitinophagales bacterium]|nr:response regulator [Chitinophagales bacterium]
MDSINKIRILVVEDAPGDVFLIKFYLEELGPDFYEIQSVDKLADAHYKMEREAFDIILLDLHLPDSEGMITLTNSIEKFPDEVFIVLTGLSDQEIGLEAVKRGAQDFLIKGRIDSKTLDSSIKFSYQRSILKRKVKIFGEALGSLELMHDFLVLILDLKDDSILHSKELPSYLQIGDRTLDSQADLVNHFGGLEEINDAIRNSTEDSIIRLSASSDKASYKLVFRRTSLLKEVVVVSIKKL